jgi:hypothetical protein
MSACPKTPPLSTCLPRNFFDLNTRVSSRLGFEKTFPGETLRRFFALSDASPSEGQSGSAAFWQKRNIARHEKHFPKIQLDKLRGEYPP